MLKTAIEPIAQCRVEIQAELSVSPLELWRFLENELDWHPFVTQAQRTGSVISYSLVNGQTLSHAYSPLPEGQMGYRYSLINDPYPLENYTSLVEIFPSRLGCKLVWSASFDTESANKAEAMRLIQLVYRAGFDYLVKRFSPSRFQFEQPRGRRKKAPA